MIGGRQWNPVHVLREFVLGRRDARFNVEFILQARRFTTLAPKFVHRQLVTANAVGKLGEELRLLEQVCPGKDAEALVFQSRYLQLCFAGQVSLTLAG